MVARAVHWLVVVLLASGSIAGTVWAQTGRDSVPTSAYFATLARFNDGDLESSLDGFLGAARGGTKTPEGQWIDSICPYAMAGECYFQLGRYDDALDQFNRALQLYKSYSTWMTRVQFPPQIAPGNPAPPMPWGQSTRGARMGNFAETYMISMGNIDNSAVVRQGGVIQQPQMFAVHYAEVVRCVMLAERRRREILGPIAPHDQACKELFETLSRRPGLVNHWTQTWVDLQLGLAQTSPENANPGKDLLQRGVLLQGELDHPFTGLALLELGRGALQAGDYEQAGKFLEEATYAAAAFGDWVTLEEAFRYATVAHVVANRPGIYPPLAPALAWARGKSRLLSWSLALSVAENHLMLGELRPAQALLSDVRSSMGRALQAKSLLAMRLQFLEALAHFQAADVADGDRSMAATMQLAATRSLWLYQIRSVDRLVAAGTLRSDRVGMLLYEQVLREPSAADWGIQPLESLASLAVPHEAAFERWFELVAQSEHEADRALEVSDRVRQHRFLSTLPMGGRLLQLRWLLEGPTDMLSEQSQLQRQSLLARFPRYEQLSRRSAELNVKMREKATAPEEKEAKNELAAQLNELAEVSAAQEALLREMAVQRTPVENLFPPQRKTKDLQKALAPGHSLLAILETEHDAYAFFYGRDRYRMWRIHDVDNLAKLVGTALRDLGNVDGNHLLTSSELKKTNWRKSATKVAQTVLAGANIDLNLDFEELIIVPDGPLWYFPFEMIPLSKHDDAPLLTRVQVRYVPTVGLAIPRGQVTNSQPRIGVVLGKLYPKDEESVAREAFEPLQKGSPGAVAWPNPPVVPPQWYRTLFDQLVVLDEIRSESDPYEMQLGLQEKHKKGATTLEDWMTLPLRGPRDVVLPGLRTAAEGGLKKGTHDGSDLFLTSCGLLSTGARSALLARWRMGGQTSLDLTREYVQELSQAAPAAAWQRSVQLAMANVLVPDQEPRIKKPLPAGTDPPNAEQPIFWAGYLLIDQGVPAAAEKPMERKLDFQKKQTEQKGSGKEPAESKKAKLEPAETPARPAAEPSKSTESEQPKPTEAAAAESAKPDTSGPATDPVLGNPLPKPRKQPDPPPSKD